jgi:hypothetical protein
MSSPGNEKYVNVYLTLVPSKTPGIHPAYEEHYGNFIRDLLAKHWNMGRVYLNTTEGSTSINLCEPVPSKVPLDIITFEK